MAFSEQHSQPKTLQQFHYTRITNSTLYHCKEISPLQEQEDLAITDDKVILFCRAAFMRGTVPKLCRSMLP